MSAGENASDVPGWLSDKWAVNPYCRDEWRRLLCTGIGLRVVHYDGMYYAYASDKVRPKQQPTVVFNKMGCKALAEAMRAAEVLGEALRTTLGALAKLSTDAER